jgi:hypothetical protein
LEQSHKSHRSATIRAIECDRTRSAAAANVLETFVAANFAGRGSGAAAVSSLQERARNAPGGTRRERAALRGSNRRGAAAGNRSESGAAAPSQAFNPGDNTTHSCNCARSVVDSIDRLGRTP